MVLDHVTGVHTCQKNWTVRVGFDKLFRRSKILSILLLVDESASTARKCVSGVTMQRMQLIPREKLATGRFLLIFRVAVGS